jgi:hypothetical protein
MRSLSSVVIVLGLSAIVGAQTSAPAPLINAVQVVTYIHLAPEQAGGASSLLVREVQEEQRTSGYITVVLTEENGRHNHPVLVDRWSAASDLNILWKSDSCKRVRSDLQRKLASPLDERMGHQIAPYCQR